MSPEMEQRDGWVFCPDCANYSRLLLGTDSRGVRIIAPCRTCWQDSRTNIMVERVPPICDEWG